VALETKIGLNQGGF